MFLFAFRFSLRPLLKFPMQFENISSFKKTIEFWGINHAWWKWKVRVKFKMISNSVSIMANRQDFNLHSDRQSKVKLYHAKRKPYVNMVQKRHRVLWAKAHLKWTVSKWKSVLWSDESKFDILVGNHGCSVLRAKEEGDLPPCYQPSVQKPASLMVWGCISAYGMGSLHVLEGTMNAERYIKVLEQHMLPSRRRVFQHDNTKPHTAAITTAWLRSRRVRVLNWPACSPDLSHIENIWRIIKRKRHQRWPQTLQQLETYIRQEWDQIPKPKLQKLITSMPRRLQTVLKRRGDATPW